MQIHSSYILEFRNSIVGPDTFVGDVLGTLIVGLLIRGLNPIATFRDGSVILGSRSYGIHGPHISTIRRIWAHLPAIQFGGICGRASSRVGSSLFGYSIGENYVLDRRMPSVIASSRTITWRTMDERYMVNGPS